MGTQGGKIERNPLRGMTKQQGGEELPRQEGPPPAAKDVDLHDQVGAHDEVVGPHYQASGGA